MNHLRNSVRLIGNAGANPEVKQTSNGSRMARFSLATSETRKGEDGSKVTETQWHQLVAWGRQAEVIEKYVKKGSEMAIEGKLSTHHYIDKSGNKRYVTEVIVHELLLTGSNR